MCATDILDASQGILALIIAAVVAWIAWQQHRSARTKIRLDLYDRRFAVYAAVRELLVGILQNNNLTTREIILFSAKANEAPFLFGDEIEPFLKDLSERAAEFMGVQQSFPPLEGEKRQRLMDRSSELFTWFHAQLREARVRFAPYLKFNL